MRYALAIHKDENSCYGVTVPDLPGCFSAGDTIDEAINNAHQAITDHLELLAYVVIFAPNYTVIEDIQADPYFEGATWYLVDFDVSSFLKGKQKATVTLPRLVIARIDAEVASGSVKSRSTFLANAAIHMLVGCEKRA